VHAAVRRGTEVAMRAQGCKAINDEKMERGGERAITSHQSCKISRPGCLDKSVVMPNTSIGSKFAILVAQQVDLRITPGSRGRHVVEDCGRSKVLGSWLVSMCSSVRVLRRART